VLGLGLQGFMMWFGFIGVHTLKGFQVPHGLDAMTSRGIFLSLPPLVLHVFLAHQEY